MGSFRPKGPRRKETSHTGTCRQVHGDTGSQLWDAARRHFQPRASCRTFKDRRIQKKVNHGQSSNATQTAREIQKLHPPIDSEFALNYPGVQFSFWVRPERRDPLSDPRQSTVCASRWKR